MVIVCLALYLVADKAMNQVTPPEQDTAHTASHHYFSTSTHSHSSAYVPLPHLHQTPRAIPYYTLCPILTGAIKSCVALLSVVCSMCAEQDVYGHLFLPSKGNTHRISRVCVCTTSSSWSESGTPLLSITFGRITNVPGGMPDRDSIESLRLLRRWKHTLEIKQLQHTTVNCIVVEMSMWSQSLVCPCAYTVNRHWLLQETWNCMERMQYWMGHCTTLIHITLPHAIGEHPYKFIIPDIPPALSYYPNKPSDRMCIIESATMTHVLTLL